MRTARLAAWLIALCLALTGCQRTGEVENQAYVLILGMDRAEDGALRLTAQVPRIGKSAPGGNDKPGGSDYLGFSVEGADWPNAREALERATPRPLNLSHIEMIVVSRALAAEERFPTLMRRVVQTPHLYATARFVVCEGSAKAFVEAQQTIIGTRLSAELRAMLTHYVEAGYVPDSTLADYYYATGSIYSDPVAIHARLDDASQGEGEGVQASPMRHSYEGAALFREGRLVGLLDAGETQLLELLRGGAKTFNCDLNGSTLEMTPESVQKRVLTEGNAATLDVALTLSTLDTLEDDEARIAEARLQAAVEALIRRCQGLGTDPFGFSERAAGRFSTVPEWLESRWCERYAAAEVRVIVRIARHGAL